MTDRHPAERPGHLDIDAVSAFVDRDLEPDEIATLEVHLGQCPACHREVLEIYTTVMLLERLPQYAPRRSFCLGHEFAAAARRHHARRDPAGLWPPFLPASGATAAAPRVGGGGSGVWLPFFQTAAVAVGALLLFVIAWDLAPVPLPQPARLSAPLAFTQSPAPADEAAPRAMATLPAPVAGAPDADLAAAPPAPAGERGVALAPESSAPRGTTGGDGASEQMLANEEPAPMPRIASSVVAAVTATPALAAAAEQPPAAQTAATAQEPAPAARPSWLSQAQLALAIVLAWLIVSIAGLRRVRA